MTETGTKSALRIDEAAADAQPSAGAAARAARRLAVYARVSTGDQDVGMQLELLRRYSERCGVAPLEFVDEDVSDAVRSRPRLDELLQAARRRDLEQER